MLNQGEKLMILVKKSPKKIKQIAVEVGITPQHLARLYKDETLKPAFIKKISKVLEIEEGEFYLNIHNEHLDHHKELFEPNVDLYNIEAFAGFSIVNFQSENIQERWYIPNLNGKHIALPVRGNSMSPTINKGDKIIAKEVFRNDLQDGNIYIFISRDSGVRVKRLRLYDNATILWSDNSLYEPRSEKLDIENIVKIYHVVMVCRAI
jgi:phage repressor protein C with HTH and peptisase S24 domain